MLSFVLVAGQALRTSPWGEVLMNRILVAVAIVLFLMALPELVRLFPEFLSCCLQSKANTDLEHSIARARQRTSCCLLLLLPFCLLADRFGLYRPEFSVLVTIGAFVLYFLLRELMFLFFGPRSGGEAARAAHHVWNNVFIVAFAAMFASAGILLVLGAADKVVRTVLLMESAVFFFITLLRSGQIFSHFCSGLATILYICALEIVPAAAIVCSAILI